MIRLLPNDQFKTKHRYITFYIYLQIVLDVTAICIGEDSEAECRALVESFVGRCGTDRLQLSVGETKELVVDYRRSGRRSPPTPNWMVWWRLGRRERRGSWTISFFLCVCLIPIPVVLHFTSLSYLILFSSSSQSHVWFSGWHKILSKFLCNLEHDR